MNIIGIDFSINKPAACIFINNSYSFISWPYGLTDKIKELYQNSNILLIDRLDNKDKGSNLTSKMIYEVCNSKYLANLIHSILLPYLNEETYIAFEGLSYGSSGDNVLQLGGYKYMLMNKLSESTPLEHMFTYSPITIKSVAKCAKKGMGKKEMINAFIELGPNCLFRNKLKDNISLFKKRGGKTWIDHLDDIVDSYWALETFRVKELGLK